GARDDAHLGAVCRDERIDVGIGEGIARSALVAIPPAPGLLAEAAVLAQSVRDARVAHVRPLDIASLPDAPADVEARKVAHAARPHRHAETLERRVDLHPRRPLV